METLINSNLDILINGFKISAKTWGDPKNKPILAIHGWLDNANTFDKIAPAITQDHYLVAVDLAGHGLSDHREDNGDYYVWDYAMDILNCLDRLGWKKCSILAHSMGTGVASIVAAIFPDRIDKLIFIDGLGPPFILEDNNKIVENFKSSYKQLRIAKKTRLFGFSSHDTIIFKSKDEAIKDRMHNRISPISYKAASYIIDRGLKNIPGGYRWAHDPRVVLPECYKMTENQALQFIENINCATLILLGKEGLFTSGLFNSRLIAFNDATVHWLEGNHHLHLENEPYEISTLINQFL